jgi:hypothetical protein
MYIQVFYDDLINIKELDGLVISALGERFGWVTKNLLSQAPPCFGRHVKPLDPAAFVVVITHLTEPEWWVMCDS